MLIFSRAFMGIGGAFIMPATLSIITNVFPTHERGKAIGIWAATAGLGAALGPLTGGFLLEHFYWGSVFLVNLPIVIFGVVAGVFLIPDSKDPSAPRLDPVGAVLSIIGLAMVLFAIIEAPRNGWTDPVTVVCFLVGAAVLGAFAWWELHSRHPMLDFNFFRNPRFSAASAAITLTFFAMFGSLFLFSQYLQFVLGYTPLQTGIRLLAVAIPMMIVAPLSARGSSTGSARSTCRRGHEPLDHRPHPAVVPDRRLHVLAARLAAGDPLLRPGPDDGPCHRVDHGLAAAGQGRRRDRP